MATTERPPIKIGGKRNPEYDRWYREQKKAASQADEHPPESAPSDPAPDSARDPGSEPVGVEAVAGGEDEPSREVREEVGPVVFTLTDERLTEVVNSLGEQKPILEDPPEGAARTDLDAWIKGEDFQSAAEPEQTTNDDPREPEVAPALEAPSETILELLAVKLARNDRFVLCQHPSEKGKTVPVKLHKRIASRLLKKPIRVRIDGEGESAKYSHVR